MANKLVRYEAGIGSIVVGDSTPNNPSTGMYAVTVDRAGVVYVADAEKSAIYRVDGNSIRLLAGSQNAEGDVDGVGAAAKFNGPTGIAVDSAGNVFVADRGNGKIRRIDQAGRVSTVVSSIASPFGVAVAENNWLYVSDDTAHVVYRVTPNGTKSVFAGAASTSGDIDGVTGTSARFNAPKGIAIDEAGVVYVADSGNRKIKKIYPNGMVYRHSGSGTTGDVLGVSASARFRSPLQIAVDRNGDLLVIDDQVASDKLKRVDRNGGVSLVADISGNDVRGVAVTRHGIIYVVESDGAIALSSSSSDSSTELETSSSNLQSESSSRSSVGVSESSSRSSLGVSESSSSSTLQSLTT